MKAIPAKTKPIKHSNLFIFLGILAGLLLIGGVIAYKYVVDYYIPMQQLDQASKDLRPIYDKLLDKNKGNVSGSYYRNECSESYEKYGKGTVKCGPSSKIVSIKEQNLGDSLDDIDGIDVNFDYGQYDEADDYAYLDIIHKETKIKCHIMYGTMNYGKSWGYSAWCFNNVKNFLPGYQIVD